MNKLAIELAKYIVDNEKERWNFIQWCYDLGYDLNVNEGTIRHIYGKALLYLYGVGYEIDYPLKDSLHDLLKKGSNI